ncbi:TetR/AcrR family transcriptional regulator [Heyndrickxia ginsengihumi]|uniref:TetR/AcrR family transcriptional regulator n=1 Tax=Heyndrickxia ginsengihumi TaxID=363870 RepID=UPI00203D5314|nr:TetR/AcrR family transcriptional regulator [Heyndrickxia ginsengihumi]MCM3023304.1 TetR/AcrR family transcriptional regulator [Heyndrickxia ginsengihumi]
MKQKKKDLIKIAIKLFARKGIQATSVQDIVSEYGISKGSFYHYFSSKDELLVDIFKYYFDYILRLLKNAEQEDLRPRDKFKKQIIIQFDFFIKHRDFIMMVLREQNHSINDQLRKFFEKNQYEIYKYCEKNILSIYGEDVKPYIFDTVLVYEGIRNAYMGITVFKGVNVDLDQLSEFILKQIDHVVRHFLEKKNPPITHVNIEDMFPRCKKKKEQLLPILMNMKRTLEQADLHTEKKKELIDVVQFLLNEVEQREEVKSYVFRGMLVHFKDISALKADVDRIVNILDIKLL